MKSRFMVALAAGALTLSTAALGQMPQGDVGCLLVSNLFAKNETNAKGKQIAQASTLFYGARASALPAAQLRAALLAQRKLMTKVNSGPAMTACARSMDSSLKSLQAISSSLASSKP